MPSRFALYKLTQFPPTLDFLWVACTTTTNEQFDTNSVFCVNETLDTLPHSSLLKNTTLTLQLPDQICNSPYCQPQNSYNVSSDNLVLDQLILPELIIFSILITYLVDIVLIL